MDEQQTRRYAESDRHRGHRPRARSGGITGRPDKIAFWALIMALVAMGAAATSSRGASGGVGDSGLACDDAAFGQRVLSLGDCGDDVQTLNWILKSKPFAERTPLGKTFEDPTDAGVARFQRRAGLEPDGVVDAATTKKLAASMRKDTATWYGPGFYGNETACGTKLTRRTVGVAHRSLPCGTRVTIKYRGRYLRTRVIDRGPYAHGARWDLTNGARKRLGFTVTDKIRSAIVR